MLKPYDVEPAADELSAHSSELSMTQKSIRTPRKPKVKKLFVVDTWIRYCLAIVAAFHSMTIRPFVRVAFAPPGAGMNRVNGASGVNGPVESLEPGKLARTCQRQIPVP